MTRTTQAEWARLLFGTLARLGLRDVVISPGSRSTPFAWAALHTAELRCHSLWDERSAGFYALGQARVSGRPSALLCTSGSAAAQYFPAVVEASLAFLPLLVLSADRPLELMDTGAAQTMNQVELYGGFVRHFVELGHAEATDAVLDGLVRRVTQAVQLARGPTPGPVHLNLRARKPLEAFEPASADEFALRHTVDERLQRALPTQLAAHGATPDLTPLVEACRAASTGLIVCGPLPALSEPSGLFALAAATGFPICVEATSQARFCAATPETAVVQSGGFDALFAARALPALEPELALIFGAPPTSASFERWRSRTAATQVVIAAHGWLDPANRARFVVNGDVERVASRLSAELASAPLPAVAERAAFAERWRRAENAHRTVLERTFASDRDDGLSEAVAVRTVLAAAPRGALLGLGNSLPIRDVDAFVPPGARGLHVWSQRGVNGIDGLVSGASGAAQAFARPSLLLLGDVSFLHDLGGLAAARGLDAPFLIVVIDNGGGRIFQDLPVADGLSHAPELARFWLTPPECDIRHAAALFGLGYERAATGAELTAALGRALSRTGATLVHAVVAPDSAAVARRRIASELDDVLARELG